MMNRSGSLCGCGRGRVAIVTANDIARQSPRSGEAKPRFFMSSSGPRSTYVAFDRCVSFAWMRVRKMQQPLPRRRLQVKLR